MAVSNGPASRRRGRREGGRGFRNGQAIILECATHLAGEWELGVWREIEDYAALDKVDAWYAEDPDGAKKRDDLWSESAAYFEWGPCRLMGDYPESAE